MALLVTIGTDGNTNWVRLPSGEKMNLGSLSVLSFVTNLAHSGGAARSALDGFVRDGEALMRVDEEHMWGMLAPIRARWASDIAGPFMTPDPRTVRTSPMINEKDLTTLETHVAALNKFASQAGPEKMARGREVLVRLATRVRLAEEQQAPVEEKKEEKEQQADKEAATASEIPGLSYDTMVANRDLASTILATAEDTVKTIDRLASEGKKFNAARAKADVHAITSKVAGIVREDLTQAWVGADLNKLASQAQKLHGLFHPKKA